MSDTEATLIVAQRVGTLTVSHWGSRVMSWAHLVGGAHDCLPLCEELLSEALFNLPAGRIVDSMQLFITVQCKYILASTLNTN